MRVDVSKSVYHEDPASRSEFNRKEIRRCRVVLRRLQFLEYQVQQTDQASGVDPSGGSMFAEREVDALAWLLTEIGFLAVPMDTDDRGERNHG